MRRAPTAAAAAPLLARAPGFADAARAFVAGVLARTYRRVSVAVLAESLGFAAPAAVEWARRAGWAVDGDAVELPAALDNTPRPIKKAGEDGLGLRYADVAAVLGAQRG